MFAANMAAMISFYNYTIKKTDSGQVAAAYLRDIDIS
jgi:hypothetical protein